MTKKLLLMLIFHFLYLSGFADPKTTISGHVRDGETGEALIGAIISVKELSGTGTASNEYGFYSLTVPAGDYTLSISYAGYKHKEVEVKKDGKTSQDISLFSSELSLDEVTVTASSGNQNISAAQMGVERLSVTEIAALPVLFGEKDILKSLQLLPGVKAAGDGNSGFYIRGGGADQNLIMLDEAIVYNPSHLLGFFSTFNSDAIKDVTLYKSAMPAQYGGRLSSVEDIRMNDGNSKEYHISGGIGLISSRLNVEGPLGSENGSFLVSGRRTYADALASLWPGSDKDQKLYFYDFNLKANYKLSDKDRIFLSGYYGKDKLGLGDDFGIDWSNKTATLRWNHLVTSKLFSNTSLIYSDYDYNININAGPGNFGIRSKIKDWNLKEEFSLYSSSRTSYRFGANVIHHTITPGKISNNTTGYEFALQDRKSLEGAVYFSGNFKATTKLNIDYGVRISGFAALGSGDFYELDAYRHVADTLTYNNGQVAKTYIIPEPRLSMSYLLTATSSIKASYARNAQYLHLISNSTASNPTDKWISANNIIKPGISDQVSIGFYKNLEDGKYELSAETYYKASQNIVDYKDGAEVFTNDAIETQLLSGKGRAYGLELLLKKKTGRLTGWIGYTLSRSELQIDGINKNEWYAARQDRTHDLSLVGIYKLTKKWTASGTFVYSTGNAVSFPSGKYSMSGNNVLYYSERNGYRMPAYHRLDLAATRELRHRKHFSSEISIGVYNAYGRENAYTINFRQNADNPEKIDAVQTSLFKWVPSISYNFKF